MMSLIYIACTNAAGTACEVYYIDQPINHYTCDPRWFGVKLECTIYHTSAKNYDIYWYRIPAGVDTAKPELANEHKWTNSEYYGGRMIRSRFRIRSPRAQHSGIYWCQVVLLDELGLNILNASFVASSPFLLYSPEQYSTLPPCSSEFHSQHQSTCATTGEDTTPPSPPSEPTTSSVNKPATSISIDRKQESSNSATDSGPSDDLPPWGYAVVAGGGVISLIIIAVILCTLLVFCQNLQKYAASKLVTFFSVLFLFFF